jgi:hypothetical protein
MKLTDLERKCIVLAMDPSAGEHEAGAAATKFVSLLRKRYRNGHELVEDLEKLPKFEQPKVVWGDTIMTFGKHHGMRISEIPPDYLLWVLGNCENMSPSLRQAMQRYMRLPVTEPDPFGQWG